MSVPYLGVLEQIKLRNIWTIRILGPFGLEINELSELWPLNNIIIVTLYLPFFLTWFLGFHVYFSNEKSARI